MSVLCSPHFHYEAKAFAFLESIVRADGVSCPHCGVVGGKVYDLAGVRGKPSVKNPEGAIRFGLKKCGEYRKQFTVKVGTVFEHARMPLHKMLQAVHLMISSKKGISSHQLSRVLEVQYETAWFLAHRIREAMRSGDLAPFGSGGTPVEVDETYFGVRKGAAPAKGGTAHKLGALALVDRATGTMRSFTFDKFKADEVHPIVRANISREARLITDEARMYVGIGKDFAEHGTTLHAAKQYVDYADRTIHTNTVEGALSIFKRGMKGVYQHCGEQHLHRYLAEFEFRYDTRTANGFDDRARTAEGLKGIVGKRFTYRWLDQEVTSETRIVRRFKRSNGGWDLEPDLVSNIYYDSRQPIEWKNMVSAKELLHILDGVHVPIKAEFDSLTQSLALPDDTRGILNDPDFAFIDKAGTAPASALLLPLAAREALLPAFKAGLITASEIARQAVMPVEHVRVVMSDYWPKLYPLVRKDDWGLKWAPAKAAE